MNYAHIALQNFHILPSVLARMTMEEKALVYASIDLRIERDKRQQAKF